MPARSPRVATYVSEALKRDLDRWADAENRTVSNLVATILQQAVDEAKEKGIVQDALEINTDDKRN